jgi:hypothetical protein
VRHAVPMRMKRRSRRERIDASRQPGRKGLPYLSTIRFPGSVSSLVIDHK